MHTWSMIYYYEFLLATYILTPLQHHITSYPFSLIVCIQKYSYTLVQNEMVLASGHLHSSNKASEGLRDHKTC